jgi:hypothetical protein
MALVCITLLGLAVPGYAYPASAYAGDPYIKGQYKCMTETKYSSGWSSWSSWTLNKLTTQTINYKKFNGEPIVAETQVKTRTVYIRYNGKVDTVYNIFVGKDGYREKATQYRFRTRILYWHNSKDLPTGLKLPLNNTSKAELYNELNYLRIMANFKFGYSWAVDQLKGELDSMVIGTFPGSIIYDLNSLSQSSTALKNFILKVKAGQVS